MAPGQPSGEAKTFIQRARELVASIRADASLTALLKRAYEQHILGGGAPPSDYLWVTDLNNPIAGYYARTRPLPNPPELAELFALGNTLHRKARYWFRGLPDFVLHEGKVDGGYIGLDGVVGSVDYLLGRSVLEFKTKRRAPRTPEAVVSQHPQDLEQLLFYAILLPNSSDEHYLVFLDRSDDSFVAFRVRILDRGIPHSLARQRIGALRQALSDNDASHLGRCRYFEATCKYRLAGVCQCEDLNEIDVSVLLRAVDIVRDTELESALERARRDSEMPPEQIPWWDLISPRRRLLRRKGRDPPYTPKKKKQAGKEVLNQCIDRVQEVQPGRTLGERARAEFWDCGVSCAPRLVLVRSAKRPGGEELRPYIAQAPLGSVREPEDLFDFYIAELAIRCAITGCPRGVAFLIHPEEGNEFRAYDVSFRRDRKSVV